MNIVVTLKCGLGIVQDHWKMALIATSHSASYWSATLACIIVELLSRSSRQETAASRIDDVHLFVRLLPKCKKTRFSQKLSNTELWFLLTTYRKSYMGFSKNPLLDPYNPRWLRSSFFSTEGGLIWIKFHRLVQNEMSNAVMCGNGHQMLNSSTADVWANSIACHPRASEPRITLQGAATWWIHCHDSRATCHIAGCSHQTKSMSWSCHIAGCKNSIRHIENRFSSYFIFLFLMQFKLSQAAAFVSSPIHLFDIE